MLASSSDFGMDEIKFENINPAIGSPNATSTEISPQYVLIAFAPTRKLYTPTRIVRGGIIMTPMETVLINRLNLLSFLARGYAAIQASTISMTVVHTATIPEFLNALNMVPSLMMEV